MSEVGYPQAMNNMGVALLRGDGVAVNACEAFEWIRKAAELGGVKGMRNTALCLDTGTGTTADRAAAAAWRRKATTLRS